MAMKVHFQLTAKMKALKACHRQVFRIFNPTRGSRISSEMAMKVHFQLTAKDESLESLPSAGFSDI
ncbi:MAG: hypothetical protein SPK34_00970 [Bacteroidaceae bacterium]|nr:hypothetical protein [Prevotellaceae bacterium]MDY5759515.1 hypothetical protein [Bacteroidaceae bacterium]